MFKKFLKNPKSGTPNNTRKLCSAVAQHDVPSSKEYNKKTVVCFLKRHCDIVCTCSKIFG